MTFGHQGILERTHDLGLLGEKRLSERRWGWWLRAMKLRLHQFLSKTGHFSSKQAVKEAVWAGEVTVNGSVVKDIAFQFKVSKKEVAYKGQVLRLPSEDRTFLLNKPTGVICSRLNPQERSLGKRSVFELFRDHVTPSEYERLVTVGRLDEDTSGLLLVTTSGGMVHRIASPEMHVAKVYRVTTAAPVAEEQRSRLAGGLDIELEVNGEVELYRTRPAEVSMVDPCITSLTLSEGKKRQVRRMFAALGHEVVALERTAIGGLQLAAYELETGEFIDMSGVDVEGVVLQG
ncbi:MAG: rRNA pseudouridine synthase [Candidatus Poseidonia sp.]|nr:rRNA pseudouridine synthase [Poseidonia sp.]